MLSWKSHLSLLINSKNEWNDSLASMLLKCSFWWVQWSFSVKYFEDIFPISKTSHLPLFSKLHVTSESHKKKKWMLLKWSKTQELQAAVSSSCTAALSLSLSPPQLSAAAAVSFPPPSQHPPVQDYLLITPDFLYDVFVGCDRLRAYRCQSKRTLLQ